MITEKTFNHAFLAGIFTGAGYVVESNKEHGEGRSDVIVYDLHGGRMAIFEAKYSKTLKNSAMTVTMPCARSMNACMQKN